jgi:hypothetical protein
MNLHHILDKFVFTPILFLMGTLHCGPTFFTLMWGDVLATPCFNSEAYLIFSITSLQHVGVGSTNKDQLKQ